jgi:hypothetical protein
MGQADGVDRDGQTVIAHRQHDVGHLGVAHRQFGGQLDGGAAHRDVDGRAIDDMARGIVDGHRQFGVDADGLAGLTGLAGDRDGPDQDREAEQRPAHVQGQRVELHVEQVREEHALAHAQHDPEHDQADADQVRLDDRPVEERAVEQVALVGHVELALARVEPGHDRGRDKVEGQDRLVDFPQNGRRSPACERWLVTCEQNRWGAA